MNGITITLKDGRILRGEYFAGLVKVEGVLMMGRDFYREVSCKYGSGIARVTGKNY